MQITVSKMACIFWSVLNMISNASPCFYCKIIQFGPWWFHPRTLGGCCCHLSSGSQKFQYNLAWHLSLAPHNGRTDYFQQQCLMPPLFVHSRSFKHSQTQPCGTIHRTAHFLTGWRSLKECRIYRWGHSVLKCCWSTDDMHLQSVSAILLAQKGQQHHGTK